MSDNKKSYYAVIPANVRYDKRLCANAKLLYGEITALTNEKGYCWASNGYFAELYQVSKQSISTWIKQLNECNYITVEMVYKEGSKEILNRYIRLFDGGIQENFNTPIKENLKDNIISINTTSNNTKEKKESDKSLPPFYISLASLIYKHSGVTPTKSQLNAGAKIISDINRLDNYSEQDIQDVINYALADSFWSANVQSPASLRNKRNGSSDLTKFAKIYNQWKSKRDAEIKEKEEERKRAERAKEWL